MTDREKLVELFGKDTCKHDICLECEYAYDNDACLAYLKNSMADLLITNGVTFAKDICVPSWIPVSVWLPESGLPKGSKVKQIKVLTALISDKGVRTVRSQMRYKDTWATGYQEIWRWKYSGSEITHWMPLPEPPKEE